MTIVLNVSNNPVYRREFSVSRDPETFMPLPPTALYTYLNQVLQDLKHTDFVVHLAYRHDYSVPDIFDTFNCNKID